jgi:DNA-binding beta-propeller fold protein YncE
VARIAFDAQANEVYVADGYINRRVVVLDMNTGAVKRFWGAYGRQPDDADIGEYNPTAPPAQQFRTVTCAVPSRDGMVYVCDRGNNRIQVFRKDGTYVTEKVIAPTTRGLVSAGLSKDRGSVWDIAFSPDATQRFLYVADGMNERVWILDRATLEVQTTFGTGGRYPSHFQAVGSIAVDSQGNIYTGEDEEGKRVQKFRNTGVGPVRTLHQGAVWPGNP